MMYVRIHTVHTYAFKTTIKSTEQVVSSQLLNLVLLKSGIKHKMLDT